MGGNKDFVGQLLLSFFVTIPTILPPIYKFKYLFSYMNLIVGAPLVILACDKLFHFMVLFHQCYFLNESSHTTKENLLIPCKVWINKQNYEAINFFKDKMTTKPPWVELFIREDGSLHIVKCRICIEVEKKDKLFACKWDFLYEYAH